MAVKTSLKQLEDLFIKPQRSKIPKNPINVLGPLPSLRIKKTKYLPDIENSTIEGNIIKDVRIIFRLQKEKGAVKGRITGGIRTLFWIRKWRYYSKYQLLYCSSYIEFKSNGDKKKTILIKKYPEGIKPYLKDVINNFKKKKKRNLMHRKCN